MATPRNREIRLKQRPVGLPAARVAAVGHHAPNGIAIYFENVGGAHLEAALEHMNPSGIIRVCIGTCFRGTERCTMALALVS